ncbi:hypothetical protein P153DRAFT_398260, partial [Dothidotthia symphoricarpi CBS 119687]
MGGFQGVYSLAGSSVLFFPFLIARDASFTMSCMLDIIPDRRFSYTESDRRALEVTCD